MGISKIGFAEVRGGTRASLPLYHAAPLVREECCPFAYLEHSQPKETYLLNDSLGAFCQGL